MQGHPGPSHCLHTISLRCQAWASPYVGGLPSIEPFACALCCRTAILPTADQGVALVREPENPHDPHAVAIRTLDGGSLGYIARDKTFHFLQVCRQ